MCAAPSLGEQAIEKEFEAFDSPVDRECLHYVLYEEAGSNPKLFENSPYPRDCCALVQGETGKQLKLPGDKGILYYSVCMDRRKDGRGMRFDDFVSCEPSRTACLEPEQ